MVHTTLTFKSEENKSTEFMLAPSELTFKYMMIYEVNYSHSSI